MTSPAVHLRPDGLALLPGGLVRGVDTACGIVSGSVDQTGWAIADARRWIRNREPLAHLTDADVVWLLVMGWDPRELDRR